MVAALTATIIAPAKAGPVAEPFVSVANATLPKVAFPSMVDPQQRADPFRAGSARMQNHDKASEQQRQPTDKPSGDLGAMVAELAAPKPEATSSIAWPRAFISNRRASRSPDSWRSAKSSRIGLSGGRFPSSYCGVLFQRGQFSFIHGHSLPSVAQAMASGRPPLRSRKLSTRAEGIGRRQRAVLPRPLRFARLGPEARRFDRQPRLLPLSP